MMIKFFNKVQFSATENRMKSIANTKIARELYDALLDGLLVLDWRKKEVKKAEIQVAIKTILNSGLPEVYDKKIFDQKRSAVYDYIYECM